MSEQGLPGSGIRVLVVDDHSMVRAGLTELLRSAGGIEVVGEAGDGREAVAAVELFSPDVVLMDLAMPMMDGIEATRAIASRFPRTTVVALTTFNDSERVRAALAAGAVGYLLKDVEPEVLVAGIRAAHTGGSPMSPQVARQLLAPSTIQPRRTLTEREWEILRLVVGGRSNKQIAHELGISEKTVKAHLGRVFQRLGVSDRTQAALWAAKQPEVSGSSSPS